MCPWGRLRTAWAPPRIHCRSMTTKTSQQNTKMPQNTIHHCHHLLRPCPVIPVSIAAFKSLHFCMGTPLHAVQGLCTTRSARALFQASLCWAWVGLRLKGEGG